MSPVNTPNPVIQTQNLCHSYGRRRGIVDVNLSVGQGQIFGFLGPNGAGKTTTIRVLLGFLKPDRGTASIFSKDCWSSSDLIKRDVGYVAGDVRLYPWLTARNALKLVGQIRGQNLLPHGTQLAERFQLEPDLPVRRMSRGNRQKVALLLALAHQPQLVILDEPTSGLDPLMQEVLCEQLRRMAAAGHTVLFSSHTLSEVESLCDQVAIVRDGRIVVNESLSSLQSRAPRTIHVTLRDTQRPDQIHWLPTLSLKHVEGVACRLEMTGSAMEFIRWAAQQDFADVSIGAPGLETLFRGYYDTTPEVT